MSIFNDKALKSVAQAAAKIMEAQKLAKQDYDKDGKIESPKAEVLGSRIRAAKMAGKLKEETEQLQEYESKGGKYTHKGTYGREKGAKYGESDYSKGGEEEKETEKALKSPKRASKGYGARQNYKRSTRVNESLSFTEMLELYNEHGLKVLSPIETEEMDIDGTTIEVLDADKVNGVVETVVEEVDNETFTKEVKDQKASADGKKPQPKIAAGKTTGVKIMPEENELDEEQLDERAKWRSTSVAKKRTDPRYGDSESYDYHYDNPNSTGNLRPTTDKPHSYGSLQTRPRSQVASQGARKGMITKQHAERLKHRIKSNLSAMKKEDVEQIDERTLTAGETKKKEHYVKSMKKGLSGFKERYGERAKSVMYATATKMAKKD